MRWAPVLLCVAALSAAAAAIDTTAVMKLGRDALTRGEPEKAAEYFEKVVAAKPDDAAAHYRLATAYGGAAPAAGMFERMSLAKKMKAELERAIQLDPNLLSARFALLEFHLMAPSMLGGDSALANDQAAQIHKRDALDGRRAFARIQTAEKRPELARNEYAAMLKEQPRSARAHYFFGVYLLTTEKNYDAARAELETALRLDHSYMPAYFRIGQAAALTAAGTTRGEEALRKYIAYVPAEDEPPLARAHYWLGTIYEKSGKAAQARASYSASLKLNPNQKDAREAMERLR